ncbi:ArsA family ATPase [Streptomyces sp. 6N223]|uniref:ArsA family ATPase n=1 Tax=Streptomyces sp. 6N223 TaxID=3457412 RepID=UPI003FD0246C
MNAGQGGHAGNAGHPGHASGPRTLFVTGPGGDGATTIAAATALAASRQGQATLLLSAAPPERLAALLGAEPPAWPDAPAEAGALGAWAARVDAGRAFRESVLGLQRRVRPALDALGAEAFDDDELTELPGAPALALLRALRAAHASGRWELLVIDLPPATEALRLLALPEQLRRYLRRLLPPERLTARALRPLLAQLAGVPVPVPGLFDATDRWDAELAEAQRIIEAPTTSVRLVLDPATSRSLAAARAARAGIALQGLALDAVIANRMLPDPGTSPWLAALAGRQRAALREFADATGLAGPRLNHLHHAPHLGQDPDAAALPELAVPPPAATPPLPGGPPLPAPAAALRDEPVLEDRLAEDGLLVWRLPLPGATRDALGLVRRGDELVVTIGPFRRMLPLPAALRRCEVTGAALGENGVLAVRFKPDPDQWPRQGPAGT